MGTFNISTKFMSWNLATHMASLTLTVSRLLLFRLTVSREISTNHSLTLSSLWKWCLFSDCIALQTPITHKLSVQHSECWDWNAVIYPWLAVISFIKVNLVIFVISYWPECYNVAKAKILSHFNHFFIAFSSQTTTNLLYLLTEQYVL